VKSVISASRQWQRGGHTVYEGLELRGAPRLVFGRGAVVFENGMVDASPGRGIYLARAHGS